MAAQANTAPNPFTFVGESWVDVPDADRVYAENFGSTYGADDRSFLYVPAGISCTSNGVNAIGPFWTNSDDLGVAACVDDSTNPVGPFDDTYGAYPLGFDINFFGDTKDSAWPNTNGGLFFDQANSAYNRSVLSLAGAAESSAIFPLAGDLFWDATESNFWSGHTTIDGHDAVVFSWEKFGTCCESEDGDSNLSFQLVLIDIGGGDFDAWFNYDTLIGFRAGYSAPGFTLDLASGVTAGSNIVKGFPDIDNFPTECVTMTWEDGYGNATDSDMGSVSTDDDFWAMAENLSDKTVSLWLDDTCTVPMNIANEQDTGVDGYAYRDLSVVEEGVAYHSIGMGWGVYDPSDGKISSTELLHNIDENTLADDGIDPIINRSWGTTVHGRMVLGQRDGGTIGDPAVDGESGGGGGGDDNSIGALAFTGFDTTAPLAFALLAIGVGFVAIRRQRRQR